MQCKEVRKKLSAYVDQELHGETASIVASHIARCPSCEEHLESIRKMDALVRQMPDVSVGPEFMKRILRAVEESNAPIKARKPLLASLLGIFHDFFDLLEGERPSHSRALDEFSDFPPCSLGHAYLKLLGSTWRG
jgi:anti-sigma factor RsiW